jgi:hypothetical protein
MTAALILDLRRRRLGVRRLAAALLREASFAHEGASKLAHSKGFASERKTIRH